MERNPYWVGLTMALGQYPLVQALARSAQERALAEERKKRLGSSPQGFLESALCKGMAATTLQQGKDLVKLLEEAKEQWGRQPRWADPPQIPVGECLPDGRVTFLLRVDTEGELNTGLVVLKSQRLSISVEGHCRLSPTLLTNAGGIEIRPGKGGIHGNPIMRPDSAYPGVPLGSVAALVRDRCWPIRGHWEGYPPASGTLCLAINDVPGHYRDNRAPDGEIVVMAVTVRV